MAVRATPPGDELDPRLAELYHTASAEEPPPRLDQAIRSAARTGTPRREARSAPWWMAWRVPLAVASVAVVSATLAILVKEERPETVAEVSPPAPSPAVQPPPPPPALPIQPSPAPPAAPDERTRAARESVPAPQAAVPPLREPALQRKAERGEAAGALQAPPPAQSSADARPHPFPAAPPPAPRSAEPQPVPPAAAADAAKNAASAADELRQRRTAPSATIGIRGLEAEDSRRDASRPEAAPRPPMSAPAPSAKPAPPPAAKPEASRARTFAEIGALKAELEGEPPQRWLERVASLRRDGRNAEADALLAEFRKRFPNEPVPLSLE